MEANPYKGYFLNACTIILNCSSGAHIGDAGFYRLQLLMLKGWRTSALWKAKAESSMQPHHSTEAEMDQVSHELTTPKLKGAQLLSSLGCSQATSPHPGNCSEGAMGQGRTPLPPSGSAGDAITGTLLLQHSSQPGARHW